MTAAGADTPLTAAEVQARIDGVPFSTFIGMVAEVVEPERLRLTFSVRPELLGNPELGAIHGGVFASVIDIACSYAVIVPTRRSVVTVDLRTDFHRPGFGDRFVVESRLVNQGRTLAVAEAQVRDQHGKLVASGRAVLMQAARR